MIEWMCVSVVFPDSCDALLYQEYDHVFHEDVNAYDDM